MNISQREIQLDNQSYNINRTNNAKTQDSTAAPVNIINNQLAATQEGQVFQGIILDVTNNQVKIALDANNVIQAKMADAVFACFLGKSIFKQRNHCDILFVDEDRRTAYAYF